MKTLQKMGGIAALYEATAYIAGMTVMRLTTGTVLSKIKESNLLYLCFGLILTGLSFTTFGKTLYTIIPGLFIRNCRIGQVSVQHNN